VRIENESPTTSWCFFAHGARTAASPGASRPADDYSCTKPQSYAMSMKTSMTIALVALALIALAVGGWIIRSLSSRE
jgi:hypothetical protein